MMLSKIRSGDIEKTAEEIICDAIPCAKEIIAERALIGDHGGKRKDE
jgi:hypothetical protein